MHIAYGGRNIPKKYFCQLAGFFYIVQSTVHTQYKATPLIELTDELTMSRVEESNDQFQAAAVRGRVIQRVKV